MKRLSIGLFVLVLVVTGCMSPARRLDSAVLNQIREGVTTRDEVEKILGMPLTAIDGSNRKTLARYEYGRLRRNAEVPTPGILPTQAGTLLLRTVNILYDNRGKVEKRTFYESTTPYQRQMSSIWVGQLIGEKDLARIKKGTTSETELIRWFGPPMARGLTVEGEPVVSWFYRMAKGRFELKLQQQTLLVFLGPGSEARDYLILGNVNLKERKQ